MDIQSLRRMDLGQGFELAVYGSSNELEIVICRFDLKLKF